MARHPDIQLFACPACAKLYKRKVDTWIDMQNPRPLSSPPAKVPRICICGRTFLLSESTIVANLPASRKKRSDAIDEIGMDQLDIPAFLRKREDHNSDLKKATNTSENRKFRLHLNFLKNSWRKFLNFLKENRNPPRKTDAVNDVLWKMEAMALPERVVSDSPHLNNLTR